MACAFHQHTTMARVKPTLLLPLLWEQDQQEQPLHLTGSCARTAERPSLHQTTRCTRRSALATTCAVLIQDAVRCFARARLPLTTTGTAPKLAAVESCPLQLARNTWPCTTSRSPVSAGSSCLCRSYVCMREMRASGASSCAASVGTRCGLVSQQATLLTDCMD